MTLSPEVLSGLRERVKAATGPDRILDAAIAADVAGLCLHGSWHSEGPDGDRGRCCDDCGADSWGNLGKFGQRLNDPIHAYTASIDAALALVERMLPGWAWFVQRISDVPTRAPLRDCEAELWLPAPHRIKGLEHINPRSRSDGATPPLAILAALLKALRSLSQGAGHEQ